MKNPRSPASRRVVPALFALAALALAGCSWWSGEKKETIRERGCPTIGVLSDADTVTDYRPGGGRDLTDIRFRWELMDAALVCEYDGDTLNVDYGYRIGVEMGPAAETASASQPVFVAITKRDQEIRSKDMREASVTFEGTHRYATIDERVDGVDIQLEPEEDGIVYEIVIGFQLSPEQLQENRQRQRY